MSKISNDVIRTNDPVLREMLDTIVTLWNSGKISFNVVSTVPSDTPSDVELRAYVSGSTFRLYVYFPGDQSWHYAALT